jgi:hypothetical protein
MNDGILGLCFCYLFDHRITLGLVNVMEHANSLGEYLSTALELKQLVSVVFVGAGCLRISMMALSHG